MDETALAWMNSGFYIRQSTEFQTFANKQLTMDDRSKLIIAMNLANSYHSRLGHYLSRLGFSYDSEKHNMENMLANFLEEAFKSTIESVLHTAIEFTSASTLESVDGFVTFFENQKELGQHMSKCLSSSTIHKSNPIYRLIVAQLHGRTIPKIVPGVNMNPPKDAKEWFRRVKEGGKLNPVMNIANSKAAITAAKNDMLPEGEKENNDDFDSIYRSADILSALERNLSANIYQKQIDMHMSDSHIPDIRTALDNMQSYKHTNRNFYQLLNSYQRTLNYSLHGFDSDFVIQDVITKIRIIKDRMELRSLYTNVSKITALFGKAANGCLLQAGGTISCENKFIEDTLHELEQDATKRGHVLFTEFLSEARKLNSVDDVRNLARTYLVAESADLLDEIMESGWYNVSVHSVISYRE